MEILTSLKFLLKIIGMLFTHSNRFWYKFLGYFGCFSISLLIYPVGKYVITTLNDVSKFSEIMPIYSGMLNSLYKSFWFLYYRNEVIYLLTNIQDNINKSKFIYSRLRNALYLTEIAQFTKQKTINNGK